MDSFSLVNNKKHSICHNTSKNYIQWKIIIFLYIIYIFINTDVFSEDILNNIFPNSYSIEKEKKTTKGIFTSGIFLILLFIIIDNLINLDII
jgi:Na+/serine symporter